jgi:hypothetical protein
MKVFVALAQPLGEIMKVFVALAQPPSYRDQSMIRKIHCFLSFICPCVPWVCVLRQATQIEFLIFFD